MTLYYDYTFALNITTKIINKVQKMRKCDMPHMSYRSRKTAKQ